MGTKHTIARAAGLFYLLASATIAFGLRIVPESIDVPGDAAKTLSNIMASESLFRLGIVAGLVGFALWIFLHFFLHKLLSPVDKNAAALMVGLGVISVPIAFVALSNRFNVLSLIDGAHYRSMLSTEQLQAQVMLSIDAFNNAILVAWIFWGLWLVPFGYLVFKSGFLPKALGIFLMIACFGYLFGFLRTAHVIDFSVPLIGWAVPLGEFGTCLWLLIMGARPLRMPNNSLKSDAAKPRTLG
jgi:Domain of unknown function (DUF4386)